MNRVVIVTGGSSGIGKASVEAFKKQGDIVYSLSRSGEENEFDKICDITNEEKVNNIIKEIVDKHKKINIVVNNAGSGLSGALEFSKMDEVKNMFDVNVFGAMNIIKSCLPFMGKGDRFINISSTCAFFAVPFRSVYCATKASLSMMSYGLYMECKDFGIEVATICPGEVKTNFSKNRKQSFETSERYGDKIKNASDRIEHNYEKRMPPEKLVKTIVKQANKKHCNIITIVGFKFKLLYFINRFLPMKFFLKMNEKFMGGHKIVKNKRKI